MHTLAHKSRGLCWRSGTAYKVKSWRVGRLLWILCDLPRRSIWYLLKPSCKAEVSRPDQGLFSQEAKVLFLVHLAAAWFIWPDIYTLNLTFTLIVCSNLQGPTHTGKSPKINEEKEGGVGYQNHEKTRHRKQSMTDGPNRCHWCARDQDVVFSRTDIRDTEHEIIHCNVELSLSSALSYLKAVFEALSTSQGFIHLTCGGFLLSWI